MPKTAFPTAKSTGRRSGFRGAIVSLTLLAALALPLAWAQYPAASQVKFDGTAVLLEEYATAPLSAVMGENPYPPPIDRTGLLARVNALRSEPANAPGASSRFFVNDSNGILYILDKDSRKFTPYLDLGKLFPKFGTDPGYGAGLVSIAFDPEYASNGKFYTAHTETVNRDAPAAPATGGLPGLNLDGYAVTEPVNPPAGTSNYESVLVEWTDSNIRNDRFEGTAREILRIGFNAAIHQMGDLLFNPLARPGGNDYRNLYVSVGDGASGETAGATQTIPQQLNALQGKILRITPDLSLRPADALGPNGRYRVPSSGPDPNPFVSVAGARGEIYAYGFRNPHRMTWDAESNTMIADDIGLHSWEEVNIVLKGGNYGYAEREGNEQVLVTEEIRGLTGSQLQPPRAFPQPDLLRVAGLPEPVTPLYPAVVYSHREGDSVGSGFVYRGKLMPQLVGKYLFTDIPAGRLFYADLGEMLAARGVRNRNAAAHEIQIRHKSPYTGGAQPVIRRMYDIVAEAFAHREGIPSIEGGVLPGFSPSTGGARRTTVRRGKVDTYGVAYAGGRADVRLSMGGDGEIYVLSKADGVIRRLAGVVTAPPSSRQATAR